MLLQCEKYENATIGFKFTSEISLKYFQYSTPTPSTV